MYLLCKDRRLGVREVCDVRALYRIKESWNDSLNSSNSLGYGARHSLLLFANCVSDKM